MAITALPNVNHKLVTSQETCYVDYFSFYIGTGVTTYALHPGVVQTELGRHIGASVNGFVHWAFHFFGNFFFKTTSRGAQTTIYCAVDESLEKETGKYYR